MFENLNGYNRLYKDSKDISNENVNIYVKLDTKNIVGIIKRVSMLFFLLVLIYDFLNSILDLPHFKMPSLPESLSRDINIWILIFISLLINFAVAMILHLLAYKIVSIGKGKGEEIVKGKIVKLNNQKKTPLLWKVIKKKPLYYIVSPDYFFADYFKSKLKERASIVALPCEFRDKEKRGLDQWDRVKIERKFFVEYSNWLNVCFIIFLTILMISIWNYQGFLVDMMYYFLLIRLLSRSIEIVWAYYKDVVRIDSIIFRRRIKGVTEKIYVNNWKSSAIRKPARISLACHTLLEMLMTFALLYYFVVPIDSAKLYPVDPSFKYWEFFAYSLSINVFNFSYTLYPDILWRILHVSQVFIGVVLIVLSLARYLGLSDEITMREEKFFIEVEKRKVNAQKTKKKKLKNKLYPIIEEICKSFKSLIERSNLKLKKWHYFLLVVLICIIPFVIHSLMTFGRAVTSNDWIGFFGSYSGGIIGGIVALVVVRIQVKNTREDVEKQIALQKNINSQNKVLAERVFLDYTLDIGSLILSEISPENNFILLHSHTGRTIKHNPNEELSMMKAIFLKTRFYGNANCIMDFSVTIKLKDFQIEEDEHDSNIYIATMHMGGINNNETVYVPLYMEEEKLGLIYVEFEYTTLGNERIKYTSNLLEKSEEYFYKDVTNTFVSLKKRQINNESYIVPGNPLSKN